MPLVTRSSNQGNLFKEANTPNWSDGDIWSDITSNTVKVNVSGTATAIGQNSFNSAAVVSYSQTIGDYTTPTAAISTSNGGAATVSPISGSQAGDWGVTANPSGTIPINFQNIFDNDDNTLSSGTVPGNFAAQNQEIRVDFGVDAIRTNLRVKAGCSTSGSPGIGTVHIETSADGSSWTTEGTVTSNQTTTQTFASPILASFRYVRCRITITQTNRTRHIYVYEISAEMEKFPSNAIDDDTAVYWQSAQEVNPAVYVDCGGSALNLLGIAIYLHANTTETEIAIRASADTTFTSGENTRTILVSELTAGAWNYIRFNVKNQRYIQIYGNSGSSLVLAISEIKYLTKTDAQVLGDLGILEISTTDTAIGLDGT